MIDFFYIACCKTDLVSIGTVSMSCASYQFLLRKLALQSFFYRNCRICSACYAHRLIYIGSSGKRVTDGSAKAGCSTAKRLDLCRMVVCLIFKVDQPLFFFAVNIYRNYNTAGIDLVRFLLILKLSFRFQFFHCHQGKIHQTDEFIVTVFIKNLSVVQVLLICFFDRLFIVALAKFNICKLSRKGSMTAVI